MKNLLLSAFLLAFTLLSCSKKNDYQPDHYFSKEQQATVIRQTIYYSTKTPPGSTQETKFSKDFDWYYNTAAAEYDVRRLFPAPDSTYYFLMTRKARSIWPAREAIGGKLKVDGKLKLLDYEEEFRTWKMTEDTLNTRAFELFELMVKGEDLTPFRSKYKGDRYIEFPDDRFYFDKTTKQWHDTLADSLKIQ